MKKVTIRVVLLVVIVGLCAIFAMWANDVHQDRKHVVIVNSKTPIFGGRGEGCETPTPIFLVQPGAVLRVRRIRYWKECATLDVKLPDRASGHIVLGIGNVSVRPPLH